MGTQLPSPKRGTAAPLFGPCLLWPNGWMDQGTTWYGGRPQSRRRCVRLWPSSPRKGSQQPPPTFRPTLLWHGRPHLNTAAKHLFFKTHTKWTAKMSDLHRVSKNVPPLACYNFETHEWILIFFGGNVTDKVGNQKTLYYATSSKSCFCTTCQNAETRKSHFHSVGLCYTHNAPVCCLPERKSCHLWCVR